MTTDFTKPVRTRSGEPVTILTTERKNALYPVVALVNDNDIFTYTAEGKILGDGCDHGLDLVNVPVKHTRKVWLNVYPRTMDVVAHHTKECANEYASSKRIACIPVTIEFEEGQGLQT